MIALSMLMQSGHVEMSVVLPHTTLRNMGSKFEYFWDAAWSNQHYSTGGKMLVLGRSLSLEFEQLGTEYELTDLRNHTSLLLPKSCVRD